MCYMMTCESIYASTPQQVTICPKATSKVRRCYFRLLNQQDFIVVKLYSFAFLISFELCIATSRHGLCEL
jgi:hypothetical protein